MKKKIVIILIVIAIVFCGIGGVLLFITNDKTDGEGKQKETVSQEEDLNYIDRSSYEEQVRKSTGNIYYTVSTSRQLATDRTYDTLELTNPWLVRMDKNYYSFSCVLHNHTDEEYPGQAVIVRFVDEDGKVLDEVETQFFDIPPDGMSNLYADTNVNILDAYDFEIVPKNA